MPKKSQNIKKMHNIQVSLKNEIAPNIQKGVIALKENFVHRVLVFSISGTYIVDLKDTVSPAAKLSSRLLPDYLADFLSTMVKMTQRSKVRKANEE